MSQPSFATYHGPPRVPVFGPFGDWREPTEADRGKDAAVASLVAWFDLDAAMAGLRAFYRYDRFREARAAALKANPPKYARWWNR